MGKALIIAEKPSVASDIAKALGGFKKHDDYYESDHYVLSSAVGHLLAIVRAGAVRGQARQVDVCPSAGHSAALRPAAHREERGAAQGRCSSSSSARTWTALINACDAGREGELIFRYIVQYAKAKQTIQRLWLQSMTPAAIREGFAATARRRLDASAGGRRGVPLANPTGSWASTARGR